MKLAPGQRFNRLTAVKFLRWKYFKSGKRQAIWEWMCECGKSTEALDPNVKRGHTQSCGCLQSQRRSESHKIHGQYVGGNGPSRPMRIWRGMLQRCLDENSPTFEYYGAKGIRVEWPDFEEFWKDMGPYYRDGLTIERLNNSKNYCKENCCWATHAQQNRNYGKNRLLTYNGITKPMVCWAEDAGINQATFRRRIELGWSIENAVRTPIRRLS